MFERFFAARRSTKSSCSVRRRWLKMNKARLAAVPAGWDYTRAGTRPSPKIGRLAIQRPKGDNSIRLNRGYQATETRLFKLFCSPLWHDPQSRDPRG
jgi:hypothetical protein